MQADEARRRHAHQSGALRQRRLGLPGELQTHGLDGASPRARRLAPGDALEAHVLRLNADTGDLASSGPTDV